jgi:hypothetical protein
MDGWMDGWMETETLPHYKNNNKNLPERKPPRAIENCIKKLYTKYRFYPFATFTYHS